MRVAGLDFGAVRVGVALSDELGLLAHPRQHLPAKNRRLLLQSLCQLAKEEQIERFVVGLPVRLDGSEGLAARTVRTFADQLAKESQLPIIFLDERLTTRQAQGLFRRSGVKEQASRSRIDSAAATLILQTWLDSRRDGDG